ncbi:MAG: SprT-like domain-containing protein [Crocinitomicaceae bacterium]|nr:SprT-like domain-containing protein [Crocinitomicaceae bacterium]MDG1659680.1 SprT-like domain-containing protein [Crocinitomicaceae bacterium]
MSKKNDQYRKVLHRYLPSEFVDMVVQLLNDNPVNFKIVKPRKTKLGDFRWKSSDGKPQITINGDLNPYSFLVTTLHEFAHLITFNKFGHRVSPHGKEWKIEYTKLLLPAIDSNWLPKELSIALTTSITKMKASSCTDLQLQRVLLSYNSVEDELTTLETLEKNSIFALNGRIFKKGLLRRTRFLCTEVKTKKQYLINALAHVEQLDHER